MKRRRRREQEGGWRRRRDEAREAEGEVARWIDRAKRWGWEGRRREEGRRRNCIVHHAHHNL